MIGSDVSFGFITVLLIVNWSYYLSPTPHVKNISPSHLQFARRKFDSLEKLFEDLVIKIDDKHQISVLQVTAAIPAEHSSTGQLRELH